MKKTKVEPSEESSGMLSENRLIRSDQKGAESDHNGWVYVMGNGQMIPGLEMAPKVFKIIYNVELGKLHALPEYPGRDPVRENNGAGGRGIGIKRMTSCNEVYRGLSPNPKGCRLTGGVLLHERR